MGQLPQNDLTAGFFADNQLSQRETAVIRQLSIDLNFKPEKVISRSTWWGDITKIGAFHVRGFFDDKPVVLKVQGVKPAASEADMIRALAKNNTSQRIRPPHLLAHLPWDEKAGYEALMLEEIRGESLVGVPTTPDELNNFFAVYADYRAHCLQRPWVGKPSETLSRSIATRFKQWGEIAREKFPYHPLRQSEDESLIDEAVDRLVNAYQTIEPEFVHGHFSVHDVRRVGSEIILLSNLYWSWRPPLYDAVFAYHWHLLALSQIPNLSFDLVANQQDLWLEHIQAVPQLQTPESKHLLKLARIERAAAGLNLDVLALDPTKSATQVLVEFTRAELKKLLNLIGE